MTRGRQPKDRPDEGGRITVIEVISFSAVLAFIAAFASGAFDAMVPWK
jgi:hypothetical protein